MASRRVGGRAQLDLNLRWNFPIAGQFNGFVRTDILNLTEQQGRIGVAGMAESCIRAGGVCTEDPSPLLTTQSLQYPRTIRVRWGSTSSRRPTATHRGPPPPLS